MCAQEYVCTNMCVSLPVCECEWVRLHGACDCMLGGMNGPCYVGRDSRPGGPQWPVQTQGWQASGELGTRQTALAAGGSEGGEGRVDQAKDSGRMLDAAGTPCGGS